MKENEWKNVIELNVVYDYIGENIDNFLNGYFKKMRGQNMFLKSIAVGVTPLKSYRVVCVNKNDHDDSVSLRCFYMHMKLVSI